MEHLLDIFLPIIIIAALAALYILFLMARRNQPHEEASGPVASQKLPQSAPVIPYMEPILVNFHKALKQALPEKYIIYANVPLEKLFDVSKRKELCMQGQYADFVVFTPSLMPILAIDLFDMSIVNLDRVNKIKKTSKEILRNSGIPVLDYRYTDNCNIDDLRRAIANLLNPLREEK